MPASCTALCVRCPGRLGSCSPVCTLGVLCCVCVSWATWILFNGVLAPCVVLRVRGPGALGSRSPVCMLGVLCCVCGVLGDLAPVHRCARSVCCFVCVVSWATWLLFTGVHARSVVLCVRCLRPLSSCSQGCTLGVLCCVCGVLEPWLPSSGVHAWCAVLCVRCPGRLSSCAAVCTLAVLCCLCVVLGQFAPVHRSLLGVLCCACGVLIRLAPVYLRARSVCCVVCAVSWVTWVLFTGVLARSAVLRVWCPGPLKSCLPPCKPGVLCCVSGVLGHLAPVHRCAPSVCCAVCAVSWATGVLSTRAHARCVVLHVQCPGPLGSCSLLCMPGAVCACCPWTGASCSPVLTLGALCCMCGALDLWVPMSRLARVACCVCGAPGNVALVLCRARVVCCVPVAAVFVFVVLVLVRVVCVLVVLCVWCLGSFAACIIPFSQHFSPRPRLGGVGVLVLGPCVQLVAPMVSSPAVGLDALMTCAIYFFLRETSCISRRPRVGVWSDCTHNLCYLLVFVLDSPYLATPKTRRVVLMHS